MVADSVDSAVAAAAGGTGPATVGGDIAAAADGVLVVVECAAAGPAAGGTAVDVAGVVLADAVAAMGEMIADVGQLQYWHVQEKTQTALTAVDQVVSSPVQNRQNSDGHDS